MIRSILTYNFKDFNLVHGLRITDKLKVGSTQKIASKSVKSISSDRKLDASWPEKKKNNKCQEI